jgi:predicted dehydrogenase
VKSVKSVDKLSAPLRIGALGVARITPNALIKPAHLIGDVQVMAIAARDPARARAFAARHQIPRVHENYAALLDNPQIDAIYNPLPNSLHAEWTIRALEAGKHVLCEKPLASNAQEAEQMTQVAQAQDRLLMEAFHYQYHPLFARMKAIIASGELGSIQHLEAHFCTPSLRPGNIRLRYDLGGGATMDLGCYTIHLIRQLAGAEPTVVRAQARTLSPQVDRWMEADFAFADGRAARMTCSLLSTSLLRLSVRVVGAGGEMHALNPILPHLWHRLTVCTAAGTRHERLAGESTYTCQLRAFVQAVRAGEPTDAADAIANMQVIDAVYQKAGLALRGI